VALNCCCYDQQKKAAFRNANLAQTVPRSTSESSSNTQVTLPPPPRPCPMMPVHTNQPWFHGHISRERSVSLLAEHGLVDGFVFCSLTIWTCEMSMLHNTYPITNVYCLNCSDDSLVCCFIVNFWRTFSYHAISAWL